MLNINLPPWLDSVAGAEQQCFADPVARMAFVIDLAHRNVREGTGGPFAAAVFELISHRLVAVGVNLVAYTGLGVSHAEVLALSLAQQSLGTFDLGAPRLPGYELVCSCEPCLMCLGAVMWSGVRRLSCAARDEDAHAIGFDEGPKPQDWTLALQQRGIDVVRDLLREQSCAVLALYQQRGGMIYNPTHAGSSPGMRR
ncbi:MAG: nucleoside deaminase [Methylococcaceae bacterium]|nr:MAG: nucleoside deaminase [Methylococcaceae bacterium]